MTKWAGTLLSVYFIIIFKALVLIWVPIANQSSRVHKDGWHESSQNVTAAVKK